LETILKNRRPAAQIQRLKEAAVGTTMRGTRAFRIVTTGTPTTATTTLASALPAAQNDKPILNRRRYPSL